MVSTRFEASSPSLIARNTVIAAAVTLAINVALYFLGDAAGWIPDDLPARAESFGLPALIVSTVAPIIGGGIVLSILVRVTHHPVLMFCLIASIVFIATLFAPLTVAGASVSFRVFLVTLHVVTVVVGTFLLTRDVADEPE